MRTSCGNDTMTRVQVNGGVTWGRRVGSRVTGGRAARRFCQAR